MSIENLIVNNWIIPMTIILVAYALIPLRRRMMFWLAALFAVVSYAVWLALYIGVPPPQI